MHEDKSTREIVARINELGALPAPTGRDMRGVEAEVCNLAFALAARLTPNAQDRADEDWIMSIANEYRVRADREQDANPDGIWPKFFRDRAEQIERTCRRWGVLGA